LTFRKDINGLRAIAVVAVLLFHFNPAWLPGGFAGVDVFFVISGFLMTGIIFRGFESTESGTGSGFNLFRFYAARAKRIIPALAVLCLVLLAFGWLFLIPLDYKELSKHAAGSVTFISNIIYWREAGYFDAGSHEKWLLHTWSLSVEWQFYLIYPLVLLVLRKMLSIENVKRSILICAVLGFVFCVTVTYRSADAAYFLLPTRAWQMLLGGIAYLYPLNLGNKNKRYFEWMGLALIISSYFLVSAANAWPGYLAIFPVAGAFFVIQSQRNDSVITNNIVFQKIGLWSYSIYLWHWVIVVASIKFKLEISIFAYLAITIFLGFLSYQLIERRNKNLLITTFVTCLAFAAFVFYTHGVGSRVDEKFQLDRKKFHELYYGGAGYPANEFIYINSNENSYDFVFAGDSYGAQYAKALEEKGLKVAGLFDHGCLIFPNYTIFRNNQEDVSCSLEYAKLSSVLEKSNKPLLMAYSWASHQNRLILKGGDKKLNLDYQSYSNLIKNELDAIVNENGLNRLYFILGVPQSAEVNAFECLAGTQLIGYRLLNKCPEKQDQRDIPINSVLSDWARQRENTYFINPNDFLCKNGSCLIIKNREPIHSDPSHLSAFGAPLVVNGMFKFINDTLTKLEVKE
jgi:peptidoglycan/LPS O-acetylase OafA/YrhL